MQSSPFLIFLINFSEEEYNAIEFYLKQHTDGCSEQIPSQSDEEATQPRVNSLPMTRIATTDSLTNKRIDMYLKGGIFSVSYKAIVLDLLTKRLSPSIISGFIVNESHKVQENSQESFLCKILRRDSEGAFIKAISDKASSVARGGGMFGIENLMKSL